MEHVKSMTYADYIRHKSTKASRNGFIPAEILDLENKAAHITKKINHTVLKVRAIKAKNPGCVAEAKKSIKTERERAKMQSKQDKLNRTMLLRQREKLEAKREKERKRIDEERLRGQKLPDRNIDLAACVPVRLDAKTVIYVKPGTDIDKVKEKFRNRNKIE